MWTGAHGGRLTKSMMLMWPRPFKKWSAGNLPNSTNEKRDFVLYCSDCRSPCSRWNRLPLIADTARSRPSKQAHSAPESLITFWGFFLFFLSCLVWFSSFLKTAKPWLFLFFPHWSMRPSHLITESFMLYYAVCECVCFTFMT